MTNDFGMKVTILGWWGTFPKGGEATSGVMIETNEGKFLLDCGSGVLSKYFLTSNIAELQGVLLTHLHYDHMGDLGSLQYAVNHALRVGLRQQKLKVYAPRTPEKMWEAIQYPFTESIPLTDGVVIEVAGTKVTVQKVNHTIECYSFRVEKDGKTVIYYTDTTYRPDGAAFLKGADLLICGAPVTEGSRHTTGVGHMSDLEAGQSALDGGVGQLCLFHLPSDSDPAVMRQRAASVFGGPVLTPDQQNVFLL